MQLIIGKELKPMRENIPFALEIYLYGIFAMRMQMAVENPNNYS